MAQLINNNSLVTHSNQLTEARYSLTLGEQKVVLFLISMISPQDTELRDYNIKVQDFGVMMGLTGHSLYQRMDETLDRLMSRVIHIPKETGYLKIGWVSSAEYMKGKGVVQLRFDGSESSQYEYFPALSYEEGFEGFGIHARARYSLDCSILCKEGG